MPAMRTIRIHAIPLSDGDGGRACTVTPAAFATAVDGMNKIFEPAALRFAFDPARDWHPRNDTTLNSLSNSNPGEWWTEANEVAAGIRGEFTIFLRWGRKPDKPDSNWFAYPPDTGQTQPASAKLPHPNIDFVAVTNQASQIGTGIVLGHETGHYLGLFHTHAGWGDPKPETVLTLLGQGGPEALDGDLLDDTPPDPGRAYYAAMVSADLCGGPASFKIGKFTFAPDRNNLMSYYLPCHVAKVTLSPQQIDVMHATLRHESRAHLVAASGGVRYAGVFRASGERQALWVHDTWEGFKAKWHELSDGGLRLVDFDAARVDGQRRFTGVFHEGDGAHALWVDDDWAGFEAKWRELSTQGLRLIDLESWADGGARRYAGVFRAGTDAHALWVTSEWANFTAKWQELSAQGLRLVDLSTWVDGSRRRFAGVYRAGTDGHALWVDDSWDAFEAKFRELSGQGLRLVDLVMWGEGSGRRYAGVFRAGTGGHALWVNDDWYGFERQWQAQARRGLRLADVEVFGALVSP